MKYVNPILCVIFCLFLTSTYGLAGERKILVIPKGERVQYWQWVKQGALHAGRDRQAEIIYRGPRNSDDYDAQIGIIKDGIEEVVDAIVIAPNHASRAKPLLHEAVRKGIVVVVIDSDMDFDGRTSFIATDNYRAGQQAANHLISLMDREGDVLLLRYVQDNASTLAREKGFLDVASGKSAVNEVIDSGYVGVSVGDAYRRALELLKKASGDKGSILSRRGDHHRVLEGS